MNIGPLVGPSIHWTIFFRTSGPKSHPGLRCITFIYNTSNYYYCKVVIFDETCIIWTTTYNIGEKKTERIKLTYSWKTLTRRYIYNNLIVRLAYMIRSWERNENIVGFDAVIQNSSTCSLTKKLVYIVTCLSLSSFFHNIQVPILHMSETNRSSGRRVMTLVHAVFLRLGMDAEQFPPAPRLSSGGNYQTRHID